MKKDKKCSVTVHMECSQQLAHPATVSGYTYLYIFSDE